MIRLFLVDDHALLREGMRSLLAQETDLTIVGEASNGQALLDQLPTTPTDVVLLDLNMPVLSGVATAERLRTDYPEVRILMLSMVVEPLSVRQALAAGVHGYVLKNAVKDEVAMAIRMVHAGQRFLCFEIGFSLLTTVLHANQAIVPKPELPHRLLSHREQEILQLVAQGLTTQQIADQLFASKRTIEMYRQNLLEKAGVKNTAALITWASSQQLLAAGSDKEIR